jgi:hypothetical protein
MKNNKTSTYILLIIVLGLWIVVFYRIYKSFFSEDEGEMVAVVNAKPNKIVLEDSNTFLLKANYQDPFLGKFATSLMRSGNSSGVVTTVNKTSIPKVKIEPVKIDWSFIKYFGLIKNHQTQKQVALVSINGRQHMVSEGDNVDEVLFVKNFRDSIKITYQRETIFLKK